MRFLKPIARSTARFELVRRIGFKYYERKTKLVERVHPFDIQYQVDTSGVWRGIVLGSEDGRGPEANNGYRGSEPDLIRAALNEIADQKKTAFVDLGCGKGRALIVATEFSFRSVMGIEISPELAQIARRNAKIIARKYPQRTAIRVITGDALDVDLLPSGDLAIFLYHPFGESSIEILSDNIECALGQEGRTIYLIYINPLWGQIFDGSTLFRRIYPATIPFDVTETGGMPPPADPVVVWKGYKNAPSDVPAEGNKTFR